MWQRCCICASGLFGIILIILGILVILLFDPLIDSFIDQELIIKNGSETYERWSEPPIVPYLNIYFFNLTNVDDYVNGKKPHFEEVGPYSYREEWKKINISFHENGTVTYQTRKLYFFDEEKSVGSENDIIHTLNVPVTVAVDRVKYMGTLVQLALSSMLSVLNETAFVKKTVRELIWGYSDPLLVLGNRFLPADKRIPFTKFGFFYSKNGSTDGIFNIYTGENGIENYTEIDSFNYSRRLNYWNTPECNEINGTDGTSYPPSLTKQSTIYLFNENLCRSIPLNFNKEVEHYGMTAFRFTPMNEVFGDVSVYPENECYCVGGPPCIGGGVFNISVCKFDTPTILSWPHFLNADEKYTVNLTGLNPDPKKHMLYIDVNPRVGAPLAAQARLQVNFKTIRVPHIHAVRSVRDMVFPIIWFEDGVTSLPDKIVDLLRMSTVMPQYIKISSMVGFFVLGIILLTVSVVCVLKRKTVKTELPNYSSSAPIHPTSSSTSLESSERIEGHTNPAMSPYHPDDTKIKI